MTDNVRQPGRSRKQSGESDTLLELRDTIDDLQSIFDTLDQLGIDNRDQLLEYIEALEGELSEMESLDD